MFGKYLLGGIAGLISGFGPVVNGWFQDSPAPASITTAAADPAPAAAAQAAEPAEIAPAPQLAAARVRLQAADVQLSSIEPTAAAPAPQCIVICGPAPHIPRLAISARRGPNDLEREVIIHRVLRLPPHAINSCNEPDAPPARG